VLNFIRAYIKSMRLYYAFVIGIAGWIGMAFYEYIAKSSFQTEQTDFISMLRETCNPVNL